MKLKAIIGCVLVIAMLTVAGSALALSLGVSPTHVELEVPGDGSATTNVKVHYFDGDVNISLIDIPLRVEPSTIYVEASDEPVAIELTIYGDNSLGSQVYDGYIRFIAVSGGSATGGVQVIAKITNIVEGQLVPELTEETPTPEVTEENPALPTPSGLPPSPPSPPSATSGTTEWPIIPVAGIVVGTAIIIAIIVMVAKRRRY